MSMGDNEGVLISAAKHFNDPSTRGKYFELYASDAVIHGYEGLEPGLPNIKRYYQALWDAFPDVQLTLEDKFSAGDRVASRFTIEGTHLGTFRGIAATGRRVRYT